jgi:hypothetical protein
VAIQEIMNKRTKGVQVRVGQGPGQTRFLAYRKHGGPVATRRLAKQVEKELEALWGKRIRSEVGRKMRNNVSGIPGLRFEWRQYSDQYLYLYLVGNYQDKNGRSRAFAYSVDKHGFDKVLRRGIEIRQKHGAPTTSFEEARSLIWDHYVTVAKG